MAVQGLLMPVAGLMKVCCIMMIPSPLLHGNSSPAQVRYLGDKTDIDSPFFKLHYQTSATVCFISCLLVTANDLIGNTIDCINGSIPGNVLNTYCWIMSTFSIPSKKGTAGNEFAYPGVRPQNKGDEHIYHAYYQWVPFILFFQGLLFYAPHYLWKTLEDRKLDKITKGLRGCTLNIKEKAEQCEVLVKYMRETFHTHNFYAFKYFLCDILNLINVIMQMYLINMFLGSIFFSYGPNALHWSETDPKGRNNPMTEVFPRITKCTFHKYGSSGTIEKHDAMCVLAMNIINEKIYVFLWFWFIILAVLTLFYLFFILGVIAVPAMRKVMVERNAKWDIKDSLDILMKKAQMGDWFIVFLLSKNLDSVLFNEFIVRLSDKLRTDV